MKIKTLTVVAAALLASSAFTATADDIKWDQTFAGYERLSIDDTDIKLSGITLGATKTLNDYIYATASYSAVKDDIAMFGKIKLDQLVIGLGLYASVAPGVALYSQASYINQDFSAFGESITDDGWSVGAGVRYAVTPIFEVGASVERMDIEGTKDTKVSGEARLSVATNIALVSRFSRFDDANSVFLGATYYF